MECFGGPPHRKVGQDSAIFFVLRKSGLVPSRTTPELLRTTNHLDRPQNYLKLPRSTQNYIEPCLNHLKPSGTTSELQQGWANNGF